MPLSETKLAEIFSQYYQQLVYFAITYVKVKDVAEDIVTESFLRFWEVVNSPKYSVTDMKGLISLIVKHKSIDYFRAAKKKGVRIECLDEEYHDYLLIEESMEAKMIQAEIVAEQLKEKQKIRYKLYRSLNGLAPREREIFDLYIAEGLTVSEVCKRMGVRPNTFNVLRDRMKDRIAENITGKQRKLYNKDGTPRAIEQIERGGIKPKSFPLDIKPKERTKKIEKQKYVKKKKHDKNIGNSIKVKLIGGKIERQVPINRNAFKFR